MNRETPRFLLGLASLTLASLTWAPLAWAEFAVPEAPNGYVLDEANILSETTEAQLQTELGTLDTETSTQIVVVTLSTLQGYEPEQAALKIGRAWGVGQEGTDNGIVFLIAPNDRAARIEVGYGLEGAITDAQAYGILTGSALPQFAEGHYDEGTLAAITALESLARGEFPAQSLDPSAETSNSPYPWVNTEGFFMFLAMIVFYFLPLLWALLSFFSRSKAWWAGGLIGGFFGLIFLGLMGSLFGLIGGLILDFVMSRYFYQKLGMNTGKTRWWYLGGSGRFGGGGFGGSSGGGFGGFGGGSFGGGGATGRW